MKVKSGILIATQGEQGQLNTSILGNSKYFLPVWQSFHWGLLLINIALGSLIFVLCYGFVLQVEHKTFDRIIADWSHSQLIVLAQQQK